jgi:hypothetical protein
LRDSAKSADWYARAVSFIVRGVDVGKVSDYLRKAVLKSVFDWAVGEHVPVLPKVKEFHEAVHVSDYICRAIWKRLADVGKVSDWYGRVVAFHVSLADAGKVLDYIVSGRLVSIVDACKGYDYLRKSVGKVFEFEAPSMGWAQIGFGREVKETVKTLDYLGKGALKAYADVGKIADRYCKLVDKRLYDLCKSVDYIQKTESFIRVFIDAGKSVDYISRVSGEAFVDVGKAVDYCSKSISKVFADVGRAVDWYAPVSLKTVEIHEAIHISDYIRREFGKVFEFETPLTGWVQFGYGKVGREAMYVSDWLVRDLVKPFIEYVVVRDAPYRLISLVFRDWFVGEHIPAKDITLLRRDTSVTSDWYSKAIGLHISVIDVGGVSDYIVKTPLKSLADAGKIFDYIGKSVSKIFEFEVLPIGWVKVPIIKEVKDAIIVSDWLIRDLIKSLMEYIIVRDLGAGYRGMVLSFVDSFMDEGHVARGYGFSMRDQGLMREIVAKVGYRLAGYDVRRVYFLPAEFKPLWDIIESGDHNTKVEVCKALIEAFKRVRDKLEG